MVQPNPKLLDADALRLRRKGAGLNEANRPREVWGLALSGGGIRSSTFCFGLLRGLARAKALRRFDYLSTVSGGGYIGSAFGRLFKPAQTATVVEQRLGATDTLVLWWLRNNGRYLTPSGARDMLQALASILRNTLYSLLEVGVLVLLGVGLMLLPYMLMALHGGAWPTHAQSTFGSAWLFAILIPIVVGSHSIFGYWYSRDEPVNRPAVLFGSIFTVLCAFGFDFAVNASLFRDRQPFALWHAAYIAISWLLVTPATAYLAHDDIGKQAELRLAHTKRLGYCLAAVGVLLAVAAVDWASARAAAWVIAHKQHAGKAGVVSGGSIAAIVAIVRTWLPRLQKIMQSGPAKRLPLETIVNIAGLVLLVAFVLFWATAYQLAVHPSIAWRWWPEEGMFNPSVVHWGAILLAALLFCWGTASDVDSLNLSSLHNFYRARLERAYVSTGNWIDAVTPKGRFPGPTLQAVDRGITNKVAKLVEAVEGDDIPLKAYMPQQFGGPIHLLTCCVNQTVDDRTGLYNADRKGIGLTVSSLGVETGTHEAVPFDQLAHPQAIGKLSRWVAISGAAAGSGMGSQTTPGLAALLFLTGVRLGFWSQNLLPPAQVKASEKLPWLARFFPKQMFLSAELLARFPGLGSSNWYVSDGGHFENTAVYPLLKRKLGFILVADCGADPDFGFEDIEGLVRKAEIDYGAAIRFIDPLLLAKSGVDPMFVARCGTLADMTKEEGTKAVLVARIGYADGSSGMLAVVKPRRLSDAPLEVTGYAKRNATFPQQTTADQFFDESQWEAYHQLGLFIGAWFTQPLLVQLIQSDAALRPEPMQPA